MQLTYLFLVKADSFLHIPTGDLFNQLLIELEIVTESKTKYNFNNIKHNNENKHQNNVHPL